jgi:hypothetical protein
MTGYKTRFPRRETRRSHSAWENTSLTLGVEKKNNGILERSNRTKKKGSGPGE